VLCVAAAAASQVLGYSWAALPQHQDFVQRVAAQQLRPRCVVLAAPGSQADQLALSEEYYQEVRRHCVWVTVHGASGEHGMDGRWPGLACSICTPGALPHTLSCTHACMQCRRV
jgi:hypothetical protein